VTRAFLDACVLYPPLVRALLIGAAEAGLFTPLWSARVLDEWRIATASKRGLRAEDDAVAVQSQMESLFPDARIEPADETDIRLPDPADRHVLAAAVSGGAGVLVTFNLRDFPRRVLAAHGVEARHPDGFLWELWCLSPDRMAPVVERALAEAGSEPQRTRATLKRAKLPRLGKAVAAANGEILGRTCQTRDEEG
jgi:hypothetical protein